MPAPEETRRVQRVAVKIPITIRVDPSMEKDFSIAQKEIQAAIINLSASGMGIISNNYIPEGILLIIEFDKQFLFPEEVKESKKIRLTGEVVSSHMTGGQYRLGILFKEINDEDKNAIIKFIK